MPCTTCSTTWDDGGAAREAERARQEREDAMTQMLCQVCDHLINGQPITSVKDIDGLASWHAAHAVRDAQERERERAALDLELKQAEKRLLLKQSEAEALMRQIRLMKGNPPIPPMEGG